MTCGIYPYLVEDARRARCSLACPRSHLGTIMHDLHHYDASLLIKQGESVKTVQR